MLEVIGFGLLVGSVGTLISSVRLHSSFDLSKSFLSACKTLGLMVSYGNEIALPSVNKSIAFPWGKRLIVGLPVGLSSQKLIDQRQAIAEALRVDSHALEMEYSRDGLVIDLLSKPMPKTVLFPLEPPQNGSRVLIGVNRRGEPVHYDFRGPFPHLLIGGISGGGKSVMLRSILTQLACGDSPDLYLNDLKGGVELGIFKDLASVKSLETSLQGVKSAAAAVEAEMHERYAKMAANGLQQWEGKQLIFVVDELADFKARAGDPEAKLKNEIKSIITRLSAKGRAAGVILVLATQRPSADVVDGLIKTNIAASICFRTRDAVQSRIVLDHDGAAALPDISGRLIFQQARDEMLQGLYLSADEAKRLIMELPRNTDHVHGLKNEDDLAFNDVTSGLQKEGSRHVNDEPYASKGLPLDGNSLEL